jgi:hypothetical protein
VLDLFDEGKEVLLNLILITHFRNFEAGKFQLEVNSGTQVKTSKHTHSHILIYTGILWAFFWEEP